MLVTIGLKPSPSNPERRLCSNPNGIDAGDLVPSNCGGGRLRGYAVDLIPVLNEETGSLDGPLRVRMRRDIVDCVGPILEVPYHLAKGSSNARAVECFSIKKLTGARCGKYSERSDL